MPFDELAEGCPFSSLSFRDEGTIFLRFPNPKLTVGRLRGRGIHRRLGGRPRRNCGAAPVRAAWGVLAGASGGTGHGKRSLAATRPRLRTKEGGSVLLLVRL